MKLTKYLIIGVASLFASCNAKFKDSPSPDADYYIAAYPNLTNSNFSIHITNNSNDIYSVSIFDTKGKGIFTKQIYNGGLDMSIDLSNSEDGIYEVVLKTNSGTFSKKIIKSNAN